MNAEKLDPLSKILLATQSINFMAATIHDLMRDHEMIDEKMDTSVPLILRSHLETSVELLKPIMEGMADFLNNRDAVCPIDVRVTCAAFDILIGGNDNVNK